MASGVYQESARGGPANSIHDQAIWVGLPSMGKGVVLLIAFMISGTWVGLPSVSKGWPANSIHDQWHLGGFTKPQQGVVQQFWEFS